MKFRKKPVIVEATQWFKNGDHPKDNCQLTLSEGQIVKYYRNIPDKYRNDLCQYCKQIFDVHGFIDTLEGGHIVCPGDWIITGVNGERYPCKPDIFAKTYEIALSPNE